VNLATLPLTSSEPLLALKRSFDPQLPS